MGYYAKVSDGIVKEVISAEEDFFKTFVDTTPGQWIKTSYNTRGGVHYGQDGKPDGGIALRKNYAGIGYVYDVQRDAFIPPKPFDSWILDEESCLWNAPVPFPEDGKMYDWDETNQQWILTKQEQV